MVIQRTQDDFIAASNKVGIPLRDDVQDFENAIGVQRNLQYVSPNGERQGVANKYIMPRLEDENHSGLHVVVSTRVEKVLFDENKRAVGVVCRATSEGSKPREVKAKRQVVLSAGTFGSPTILQRSGIGSAELLNKAGVPLVVENSGVGENFQEHLLNLTAYHSDLKPEETMDALHLGKYDVPAAIANNDPFLGWTGMDTICQIRPTDDEVAALGDDFKEKFSKYWGSEPNKVMGALCALNSYDPPFHIANMIKFPPSNHIYRYPGVIPPELQGQQYFGTTAFATYPFSRGYIHITGPNDTDPIDFKTGFFEDEGNFDIKTMRYLYKTQREIVRRMALYRGEVAILHPAFPAGSSAGVHSGPLTGDIKNLEYTKKDDDAIDEWVRKTVGTAWHGIGSCKMGRREKGGVVDGDLNIYGVEGLKVADLSIVGGNVAANTSSTALMIGERAADIVIKDLGLLN
jgi:choline dehydrogenase-like flavoprotein